MAKKTIAIILFLEEASPNSGVFQLRDYIVSSYTPFVKNLDNFCTKQTKEALKTIRKATKQ